VTSADSSIRLARVTDLAALVDVQLASWRAAYADSDTPDFVNDLDPAVLTTAWQAAIMEPPATGVHRLLVALEGPDVVGYLATAPASDDDLQQHPGTSVGFGVVEVLELAVAPDRQRRGHGSRLMNAAVDYAGQDGFSAAATWIALDDEPRRAFLTSSGWVPDSALRELDLDGTGNTRLRQVRLVTSLVD
jgi:GNAT superfamily N-acetyltransferase